MCIKGVGWKPLRKHDANRATLGKHKGSGYSGMAQKILRVSMIMVQAYRPPLTIVNGPTGFNAAVGYLLALPPP